MDGAIAQRLGERVVDQPVLLEERQPVEAGCHDGHLEVVAAARAVVDAQLGGVWKCLLQQPLQWLACHSAMVAARIVVMPRPRLDPYKARNFRVEIDGITASFSEVSGLESEVEVIELREGGTHTTVRKLPGLRKYGNIVLKRGITQDAELWNWHKQVLDGLVERRNGSVILLDNQGHDRVRWNFFQGWPCKYVGPTLNAESSDVAIETLELAHEGIERVV